MKSPSDLLIAEVIAGREAQALKETPGAIAVRNSTAEITPTHNLDSIKTNGRKAGGDRGSFALSLMNDPEAAARKDEWMTAFENFAPWKEGTQYQKA